MRAEAKVNERYIQAARTRMGQNGDSDTLPDSLLRPLDAARFPYLERLMTAAQKNPTAALGAMIAVAGIVIAAVVTLAVSIFTGLFLMYGTMRETTANQLQIQSALVVISKQQTDDMNALRAYESNRSRRTEFIVGLMSPDRQKAISEWDKSNPAPELPLSMRKD